MSNTNDKSQDMHLDVYGCQFTLKGNGTTSLENLANDFQFFSAAQAGDPITVEVITGDPPYRQVPDGTATTYTPRNVSLTIDNCT